MQGFGNNERRAERKMTDTDTSLLGIAAALRWMAMAKSPTFARELRDHELLADRQYLVGLLRSTATAFEAAHEAAELAARVRELRAANELLRLRAAGGKAAS